MQTKIHSDHAPKAIGPYSQAVQVGNTVYFSGQVPFDPTTMELVTGDIATQTRQVFTNLQHVCEAAGGSFNKMVKLTIYLTDLSVFAEVNQVMQQFFTEPYPARTTIQVAGLPKGAQIEIDAIMVV